MAQAQTLVLSTIFTGPDAHVYHGPIGLGGWLDAYDMGWGTGLHFVVGMQPCPTAGPYQAGGLCDWQTQRWTVFELGAGGPITRWSHQTVRVSWRLYSDRPVTVAPIVWQSLSLYSWRIFSCPSATVNVDQWSDVGCDIDLPSTEGLAVDSSGGGLGIGLDLVTDNFVGWLDVRRVSVWTIP